MEKLPKIHVILHQMGYNTKKYINYVDVLQCRIDVNLYYRVIRPVVFKKILNHEVYFTTRELKELDTFAGECGMLYRNCGNIIDAVESAFHELDLIDNCL